MTRERPRLFIECSATYYRGLNTGIQRVVRNIVKRAPQVAEDAGYDAVPVVTEFGDYWASEEFSRLKTGSAAKSSFIRLGTRIAAWLERHEKGVIERARALRLLIVYAYGISALRRLIRIGGFLILRSRFLGDRLRGRVRKVEPGEGDILLMSDAFWVYDAVAPLRKARYAPLRVITLVYDLIPITNPEFFASELVDSFGSSLPELSRRSCGFIAISDATGSVLKTYLNREVGPEAAARPIKTWYLGADLITEQDTGYDASELRPEITEHHSPEQTLLMVGTIEPRKGYDLVFKALSRLWDAGFDRHLVIVGRVGWKCEPLLEEMMQSPHYGRYLHIYNDISDAELHFLYSNVSALVFASSVEGFGLPLVEAMQQALPVIASDIPVFREIGGDYPTYFRHGDMDDLMDVLKRFADSGQTGRHPEPVSWRSWDESIAELIPLCRIISEARHRHHAEA